MAGQLWATNSLGGFMSANKLSKKLRYALFEMNKFRQFADVKDASQQGKKKGDVFTWDVYSKVQTAGGTLVETNTMPETNMTITQGTLTITEAGNAIPYTGKLDNLSEHPLTEIINKVLKQDTTEALDDLAHTEFNKTPLRAVGTTTAAIQLTTNSSATATNSMILGKLHIGVIVDEMKERNIPSYTATDYYCLAWPSTFRGLKNDLESVHQYVTEGFQMIKRGEIGKYENCRFVEQTGIQKGEANDGTAWANALSDWAYFMGNDTVAEAIATPEEVRAKIPTDYGRSRGVAWYYLGGFGLVHTAQLNARIIKWDSAD
jgi:N4-gp56 family major capsid protein